MPSSDTPKVKIPRAVPPKSRTPMYLGLAAASTVGYYLYQAGGDPKVARKEAEYDASHASASVRENEIQKNAEAAMARAGSTVDQGIHEGKQSLEEGKRRIQDGARELKQKGEQAGSVVTQKINEADRKIEDKAGKAKSGLLSWFGK